MIVPPPPNATISQILRLDQEIEIARRDEADIGGVERAADPGIEGADEEGEELAADDIDAERRGKDVILADRDKAPPEIRGPDYGECRRRRATPSRRAASRMPTAKARAAGEWDLGRRYLADPGVAICQIDKVDEGEREDRLDHERRQREIETLERSEGSPRTTPKNAAPIAPAGIAAQNDHWKSAISPHGSIGAGAGDPGEDERHQPRIAAQQVHAGGPQNMNEGDADDEGEEAVVANRKRHCDKGRQEEKQRRPAQLGRRAFHRANRPVGFSRSTISITPK